jgi:hypothetical protein
MTTLMLLGLVLFAVVVSSDLLLSRATSPQVVYVQSGESSSAEYTPILVISTLLLVIILLI